MLKRLFKLICFGVPLMLLQAYSAQAQVLLEENFDYTTGQLTTVSGGNWVNFSGTGNFIQVSSGSLSYTGYPSSGIGNKIQIVSATTSAEDAYRNFSQYQLAGATVYGSFLISLLDTINLAANSHATGEYFAGLMPVTGTSVYVNRVCIRKGAGPNTFNLGLRATSSNATVEWHTVDLNIGTTYVVIMRYQMVPGGTNDVAALFINPALGGVEPSPDLSQVSALTSDPDSIGRVALRQGSSTGPITTPNASIDGIRAGTTWGYITGSTAANPAVISVSPLNNANSVMPGSTISVTFDKLMNAATIDTASFAVSGIKQARYYPDSIRPAANSTSYTFYVQDSLRTSDTVTVTLSTAITDTGGNPLFTPYSWKFHTLVPETIRPYLVSSSPTNGADRITVNSSVVLTFNEALLPASVDTSAFEVLGVKNPKYPINPPVMSADNTVVTLTPVDSLYYGDTITVHLKPVITDISGNTLRDTSIFFNTRLTPGLSIYDLQYTTNPTGDTPYNNQVVTVSGVVTAVSGKDYAGTYYLQDGSGPWNGIYVFGFNGALTGDSVRITGTVSERYNHTQIVPTVFTRLKSGCALPAPVTITTGILGGTSGEPYEGVLVTTGPAKVTSVTTGDFDGYSINDGSGQCDVGNYNGTYTSVGYSPVVGDSLVLVKGVVRFDRITSGTNSFGIEPRRMGDVMDNKPVKIVATLPAADKINVPTAVSVQVNFNKPMNSSTVIPANFAISGSSGGVITFAVNYDSVNWWCNLIPARSFAPGEVIQVTAGHALTDSFGRHLDGNGDGTAANDPSDDYIFIFRTLNGGVPIGEIQKPGPDGFSSNMVNQTVLVEGVVTGPDFYFTYPGNSTASWYLQDGTGGINIYGGGLNKFELGLRVVVEGTVIEYSGVTEISSSNAKISIWDKAQNLPAAKELLYNQFPTEAIEGLLITFNGSISSPPSLAGGGYNMDVRNGNSPIAIRFNESAGFDIAKYTLGTKVRITGIVSQYDKSEPFSSGYQIVPRFALPYTYNGIQYPSDIELLADSVLPSNASQIVNILPNPFSPDYGEVAAIEVNAPAADHLTLRIYDLKGRLVRTLLNNTMGGQQIVPWEGTDQMNRRVNIGIYIVHLRCVAADGKTTDQTKLLVMGTKLK
jgi:DNA/RNA endonuclease YhcR with UshA esterase domain